MEHKLILGGEQFLPFARSRIKALRATGLRYASQQFEVDGVSIKVRIAGDQEYIDIVGGQSWYSVFPRSLEHPNGITTKTGENGVVTPVTPYAKARPDNKVKLNKHYLTGRFDWVSFDGYKPDGVTAKYGGRLITFDGNTPGRYPVAFPNDDPLASWVEMQNIVINGKLAVFSVPVSGIAIKDVLLTDGTKDTYVVYASVTSVTGLVSVVRFYKALLQNVFTAGREDTQIGGALNVPGVVRQPLYFDGLGIKFASFFTTDGGGGVTTTSILSGEVNATASNVTTEYSVFNTLQVNEHTFTENTVSPTEYNNLLVSNAFAYTLLGVDMTINGDKVELTKKTGGWSRLSEVAANYLYVREDIYKTGIEYMLGSRSLGFNGNGSTLYETGGNGEDDIIRNTDSEFVFGLYDADLRHSAAVWIEHEYGDSTTQYFLRPDRNFSSSVGAGVKLRAVFGPDAVEKEIRPQGQVGVAALILETNDESKMIASRESGSYMVCANIPEALNTGLIGYATAFAGVDLMPMAFGRFNGKFVEADLNIFGLGSTNTLEQAIRYTPITLIYKDSAVTAP